MRRALFPLLLALALTACGRPLTGPEAAFMQAIQGDGFDASRARIVENPVIGLNIQRYPARPPVACRERVIPPPDDGMIEGRTAGLVLFTTMHVRPDLSLPDYTRMQDGRQHLFAVMFFAHEMTHIWQWQNRALTGYSPWRVAREHAVVEDPYLFDLDSGQSFLDYGFEAQASLVEEYVCCRAVDPTGARTARLERLIGQVMPVTPWHRRADAAQTFIPWADTHQGICS